MVLDERLVRQLTNRSQSPAAHSFTGDEATDDDAGTRVATSRQAAAPWRCGARGGRESEPHLGIRLGSSSRPQLFSPRALNGIAHSASTPLLPLASTPPPCPLSTSNSRRRQRVRSRPHRSRRCETKRLTSPPLHSHPSPRAASPPRCAFWRGRPTLATPAFAPCLPGQRSTEQCVVTHGS